MEKTPQPRGWGVFASRARVEADELRAAGQLNYAALLVELGLCVGASGHGHDEHTGASARESVGHALGPAHDGAGVEVGEEAALAVRLVVGRDLDGHGELALRLRLADLYGLGLRRGFLAERLRADSGFGDDGCVVHGDALWSCAARQGMCIPTWYAGQHA